jgi:NAD(P)-dependent dehydrogenase (short-subunit alcohol dehydrogenase family)
MVSKGYRAIVSVGSVAGKEGNPSVSAYSASKAGVLGLTKSLGKELALTGVLANALTRTAFMGPMLAIAPQELVDYMTAKIPMGRLGTIDETVAMICSW